MWEKGIKENFQDKESSSSSSRWAGARTWASLANFLLVRIKCKRTWTIELLPVNYSSSEFLDDWICWYVILLNNLNLGGKKSRIVFLAKQMKIKQKTHTRHPRILLHAHEKHGLQSQTCNKFITTKVNTTFKVMIYTATFIFVLWNIYLWT